MSIESKLKSIAQVDILQEGRKGELFVGRPFYLDYGQAHVLITDYWKNKVGGIPQGCLLLAFYENPNDGSVAEALLLRALGPTKLPTDGDVVSSMVEYYKDDLNTSGPGSKLDEFTRYEFSFSGMNCRVLGTFYKQGGNIEFGADVENFFSAHNYKVFKATGDVLKYIVNQRTGEEIAGNPNEFELGTVRYSSSKRFENNSVDKVPVFINPKDFIGKRTALFGMTRTGKSNSVKIIIQATVEISGKAKGQLPDKPATPENLAEMLEPFTPDGAPKYPVGQIIFDINGEYANPNMQDEGTAIYELYSSKVVRYSVLEKKDFKVMKVNFLTDILAGFELIQSFLGLDSSDYVSSFCSIDLTPPADKSDHSAQHRYARKVAAYLACLYRAGFKVPPGFTVKFTSSKEIVNDKIAPDIKPENGVILEDAANWFDQLWSQYDTAKYFKEYPQAHRGKEWADEDLKALMVFLTRRKTSTGNANISGFRKLQNNQILDLHTTSSSKPFQVEIIDSLRKGMIVIVDLSQGAPAIQGLYSERICKQIFSDAMDRFVNNKPNNFIQFYFEEAHNLFPKKEDKDLSQIYNRLAKEGAKLGLGMTYATQEVSSISSNILKNTQNWFIAHLNNEDETSELKKYYDFNDFVDSLIHFSAKNDRGFVRMKTYSNPFVVPVQVKRFTAKGALYGLFKPTWEKADGTGVEVGAQQHH